MANVFMDEGAKVAYLGILYSQMQKILHLVEEEKTTGYSPIGYIEERLFELKSANTQFDEKLSVPIVKLNGIYLNYAELPYKKIRKEILEICLVIKNISQEIGGV